jgi:hypothetical protein
MAAVKQQEKVAVAAWEVFFLWLYVHNNGSLLFGVDFQCYFTKHDLHPGSSNVHFGCHLRKQILLSYHRCRGVGALEVCFFFPWETFVFVILVSLFAFTIIAKTC